MSPRFFLFAVASVASAYAMSFSCAHFVDLPLRILSSFRFVEKKESHPRSPHAAVQ